MKNTLIVVADLGTFKAYKLDKNGFHSHPRLELIETFNTVEAHGKLTDKVTDQAGQFPKGQGIPGVIGDMSNGERHNIQLEQRKRLVKQLAERLESLVRPDTVESCYFAASREYNQQILDVLDHRVRSKIERNVPSNLTKIDKSDLMKHFEPPEKTGT